MNRQQKEAVVADFKDMLSQSQASFIVNYKGLDVSGMISLRRKLRESGGKLKVTKARLMKVAAEGIDGIDHFKDDFKDQIGIVFALDEVAPIAKQLVEFAKRNKNLEVVSGFSESKVLSKSEVEFFASLPSREVLLAQLLGVLQAPITGLARVINAPMQQLVSVLDAIAKKEG